MTVLVQNVADLPLRKGLGQKHIRTQVLAFLAGDVIQMLLEGRPAGFVLYSAVATWTQGPGSALVEAQMFVGPSPTTSAGLLVGVGEVLPNYGTATIPDTIFSPLVPGEGIEVPANWNVYMNSDGSDSFVAFVRLVYGSI